LSADVCRRRQDEQCQYREADATQAGYNAGSRAITDMRHLQVLWHRAYSWWYEFYLRIETRGAVQPVTHEGVHYTPLPYPMIFRMLRLLDLQPSDVFVDVGCGKGRVVCCVCRVPIRTVVALELNNELLGQALENTARVRGRRTTVVPVALSAESYNYDAATVVYLYNPFNERITRLVLRRLYESYLAVPRPIRVVYANPVHESLLKEHGWLEKYAEWPSDAFPVFGYPVSFWRSMPRGNRAGGKLADAAPTP
jgi:hypothetical protein